MTDTTTVQISIENSNKLYNICKNLEQILNKRKVSIDQALSVILSVKHVEEAIADMVLSDVPKWQKQKRKIDFL